MVKYDQNHTVHIINAKVIYPPFIQWHSLTKKGIDYLSISLAYTASLTTRGSSVCSKVLKAPSLGGGWVIPITVPYSDLFEESYETYQKCSGNAFCLGFNMAFYAVHDFEVASKGGNESL